MNTEQALNVLREATAQIQANLQTHQTIQLALQTLEDAVDPKAKVDKK